MAGEDCRVANAPRNDKNVSFHSNDMFASFRSNDRVGCRGGNPLLCHCERSAAIIPRFHNNDNLVVAHYVLTAKVENNKINLIIKTSSKYEFLVDRFGIILYTNTPGY